MIYIFTSVFAMTLVRLIKLFPKPFLYENSNKNFHLHNCSPKLVLHNLMKKYCQVSSLNTRSLNRARDSEGKSVGFEYVSCGTSLVRAPPCQLLFTLRATQRNQVRQQSQPKYEIKQLKNDQRNQRDLSHKEREKQSINRKFTQPINQERNEHEKHTADFELKVHR